MKLKRRQLQLKNLIGMDAELDKTIDMFEQVIEVSDDFTRLLIHNGYYVDGPTIYEYMPFAESNTLSIYTTIGNAVNIVGENKYKIKFLQQFGFTTDYFYRHYDEEEEIPYDEIRRQIEKDGYTILTIYHVILDLYGDTIVDMYFQVR